MSYIGSGRQYDVIPYSCGLLVCISYRMICRDFGGGPCPPYIVRGGRVTSRLDLRDNQKGITYYKNHGIIRILTDLVVSLGYLPYVLREAPSRIVPHKASSCGLGRPWGRSPCGLPWVSGVVPPTLSNKRRCEMVFLWWVQW